MSLSVEIAPEVEAAFRAEAEAQGVSESELLRQLLEERYGTKNTSPNQFATATDRTAGKRAWSEFAKTLAEGISVPPLSDYAMSRAAIYEDHP